LDPRARTAPISESFVRNIDAHRWTAIDIEIIDDPSIELIARDER
jgi:hypothetical protein